MSNKITASEVKSYIDNMDISSKDIVFINKVIKKKQEDINKEYEKLNKKVEDDFEKARLKYDAAKIESKNKAIDKIANELINYFDINTSGNK